MIRNNKHWTGLEELERSLSGGALSPVYYLYGNDGYLLDLALRQIREKVASSSPGAMVSFFSADESDPAAIVSEARTLPFFSTSRVVVVKEAHLFKRGAWKEFKSYIENPVSSTTLVFLGSAMDLEKETSDLVEKRGMIVRLDHPFKNRLLPWIKTIAREYKKEITVDGATLLIDVVGNDLLRIRSELEKAALYRLEDRTIEAETIREVVAEARTDTIFSLVDSVAGKKRDEALSILWRLIEGGQPPLLILSLLHRQFRLIARGKEMVGKGKGRSDLGRELKIRDSRLNDFQDQLSRFTLEEVKTIFMSLARTDLALKSSRLDKGMILEDLILGMCGL